MNLRLPKIILNLLPFVFVLWAGIEQMNVIDGLGKNASNIADGFSESNAIRAAERWYDEGFMSTWGLPDIIYGNTLSNVGSKPVNSAKSYIYTRSPPAPDLLVGVYTKIFGKGEFQTYRIFPLIFSLFAFAFLLWVLLKFFLWYWVALFANILYWAPITTNMMHGLHYQCYAQSLLIIQFAFSIWFVMGNEKLSKKWMGIFAGLGFLQGCFSFDYVFLTISLPLLFIELTEFKEKWYSPKKPIFWLISAPFMGFLTAHLLHFVQNMFFYGSFLAPFQEYIDKFIARTSSVSDEGNASNDISAFGNILLYFKIGNHPMYFSAMWGLSLCFWIIGSIQSLFSRPNNFFSMTETKIIIGGLISSFIWIISFKNHAFVHLHFIPRHLYFFYLVFWFIMLMKISKRMESEQDLDLNHKNKSLTNKRTKNL